MRSAKTRNPGKHSACKMCKPHKVGGASKGTNRDKAIEKQHAAEVEEYLADLVLKAVEIPLWSNEPARRG